MMNSMNSISERQGTLEAQPTKLEVDSLLDKMSSQTIDGCVQLLEELQVTETNPESE